MHKPQDKYFPEGPELGAFWAAQPSGIIGEMLKTAAHFALSDLGVRIVGERGTGKQYLARLIHRESPRCNSGFTRINCSALPSNRQEQSIFGVQSSDTDSHDQAQGILELAAGGTVYFDVYEHLFASVQSKLFRAMEMRHFRRVGGADDLNLDVRVITGMTKIPGQVSPGGEHSGGPESSPGPVCINIPPLRERREDIESLIYLFLSENREYKVSGVTQITAEALDFCRHYSWPGNIYELRNVIRHSLARAEGGTLKAEDLPEYLKYEESLSARVSHPAGVDRQ